VKYQR